MNVIVKRYVQLFTLMLAQAVVLFLFAGSLTWWNGWVYLAIYGACLILAGFVLGPDHREVIEERSKGTAGGKTWDIWLTRSLIVPAAGLLILPALDYRFHWSPAISLPLQIAGAILYAVGYGVTLWAMLTNKFFSTIVRIQTERSHVAITDGPYRFVRHPGYLSMILSTLGVVALLGSWWGLLPYALYVLMVITRTMLEDRILQAELPGYAEFTQKTRYRLIPGVW